MADAICFILLAAVIAYMPCARQVVQQLGVQRACDELAARLRRQRGGGRQLQQEQVRHLRHRERSVTPVQWHAFTAWPPPHGKRPLHLNDHEETMRLTGLLKRGLSGLRSRCVRCNVAVLTTAALMKAHSTGTSPLTICFCSSLQHGTHTSVFLLIRSMS